MLLILTLTDKRFERKINLFGLYGGQARKDGPLYKAKEFDCNPFAQVKWTDTGSGLSYRKQS